MTDGNGKGQRVLGTFALMLGAGVILDVHAYWIGLLLLAIGVVALGRGLLALRLHETAPVDATAAIGEHLESRL